MRSVQIKFYTRDGCHLCDEAWQVLQNLSQEFPLQLAAIDVDSDPQLVELYGDHVPVATLEGAELFRYRANLGQLRKTLRAL